MPAIRYYHTNIICENKLKLAVIVARFKKKWVFVRHKERNTWEFPAGHRKNPENINETAKRELWEETGAEKFTIVPVCDYSVTESGNTEYGRLFYADIEIFGHLPDYEIAEIKFFATIPAKLTYPDIQPRLFKRVLSQGTYSWL